MERAGGDVKSGWAILGAVSRRVRDLVPVVLDQLYPPICLACMAPVAEGNALCAGCWRRLTPITAPYCQVLGIPLAADLGPDGVSAAALADPPAYDRARAAFAYDAMARRIVSRLKYADRPEIARFAGRMMASAGADLLGPDAVLVPVPLHYWRQARRRYNQSLELALAVARLANLPVDNDILARKRMTRQQDGLTAAQRAETVSGAFAVRAHRLPALAGRRVVLVDDVVTTGATVSAATRALKRAGIGQVDVLSFARVVIGTDVTV